MENCIFTKIIRREIPATIVYEDEQVIAFNDIQPKAPYHILVVPKKEIETLEDLSSDDQLLVGHVYLTIQKIARNLGFAEGGYRVVVNCREDGGQEVPHLHFHVLGGRPIKWPRG
ncbi:MAG: hypothetical protein RLY14_1175 [Planctomycetota bacterium]|jgi:histidine triad (HIT) family protein